MIEKENNKYTSPIINNAKNEQFREKLKNLQEINKELTKK